MVNFFLSFFYKRPKVHLVIFFIISIVSLSLLPHVRTGGNFSDFSAGNDLLQFEKDEIEKIFNKKSVVFLQLEYDLDSILGDLIADLGKIESSLNEKFENISTISVHDFKDIYYLEDISLKQTSRSAIERLKKVPVLKHLVSTDEKKILFAINFSSKDSIELDKIDEVINQKYSQLRSITPMGESIIESAIKKTIGKDIVILGGAIFLLSVFLIWIAFKSLKAFVFVAGVLSASVLPIPLVLYVFDAELNVINLLLIPIIMVLALSDAIHLLNGMADVKDEKRVDTYLESFKSFIAPSFYTSLSSALAFLSFMMNDIQLVRDFGILCAVTVMLGFYSTFVASYFIARGLKFDDVKIVKNKYFESILNFTVRRRVFFSYFLLALFLIGVISSEKIKFNTSGTMFLPKGEAIEKIHDDFNSNFSSLLGLDLVIYPKRSIFEDGGEDEVETQLLTYDIAKRIEKIPNVKSVSGIHEFIHYYYKKGYSVTKGESLNLYNPFFKDKYTRSLIQLENPDHSTDIYVKVLRILEEYKTQINYRLFSPITLYEKTDESLTNSLFKSMGLSLFMMFIIFYLISFSLKLSIIALLVNVITIGTISLLFIVFDMRLNVVTAMAYIINIGIIVDDTVHILYKFKDKPDEIKSLSYGMLVTSLTLSLGFSTFALSSFGPTASFGVLSSFIVMIALLADLTLLPLLCTQQIKKESGRTS